MKAKTGLIGLVAAVVSLVMLAGCSSLKEFAQGGPVGIAIQYATLRYIDDAAPEQQAARAEEVRAAVERVREYSKGVEIKFEDLKAYAVNELAGDLEPADRFLALQIINLAAAELEGKIGVGGPLDPEDQVALEKLLDLISDATLFYG